MLVPIMKADLYELSNNHLWRSDFHITKYGEEAAEYMRIESNEKGWTEWGWIDFGFQNYYALLNCGFRLMPSAGTASGVHPVQLGFSRVYVNLPDGFSYDGWMKGLAAGRSFVTTGPMLTWKMDDQDPGTTIRKTAGSPQKHVVAGTITSGQPLDRIELVCNGEVIKLKVENKKLDNGSFVNSIEARFGIDNNSSWVTIRAFEKRPDKRIRFVHSSPIFIEVDGKPLRPRKKEVDYLIKRVQDQIDRNIGILSPEAVAEYREALAIYQTLQAEP